MCRSLLPGDLTCLTAGDAGPRTVTSRQSDPPVHVRPLRGRSTSHVILENDSRRHADRSGRVCWTRATIGKWKLNVEKSPGRSPTASQIQFRTFEDRGGGLILATVEGINQAGDPTRFRQYAVKHDGQYYPDQAHGRETFNTIMYMKTDNPRHYEWFVKVDGNLTNSGTTTVSEDGQTMTIKGSAPEAVPSVWDRQ